MFCTHYFDTEKTTANWHPHSLLRSFCSVSKPCLTLRPHGLPHTRLPCPSLSPRVCANSYPLRRWCHPTISSSVIPFSSCLQSFPVSVFPSIGKNLFPMSWFFASGGQSIGASALASVLPMNIRDWFPLGLTGWSLYSPRNSSKSLLQHHNSKASTLRRSAFFMVQFSHPHTTTGKTTALTIWTFVSKVMQPWNYLLYRQENKASEDRLTFVIKVTQLILISGWVAKSKLWSGWLQSSLWCRNTTATFWRHEHDLQRC